MKRYGKIIIGLVLLVSLAFLLSYCSSSSSSSPPATGTPSVGAGGSAANGAIQGATLSLSAMAGGNQSAPSFRKAKNLSDAAAKFYNVVRAKRANVLKAKAIPARTMYPCDSGTMTTDMMTSGTTTTSTHTYDNCIESYTDPDLGETVQTLTNGTIVFEDSGQSFSMKMGTSTTPYYMKITLLSTGTVFEESTATLTYTGVADPTSAVTCSTAFGSSTEYAKMTITMDGNMHSKGTDESGVYDDTVVATAFKLDMTNTIDAITCDMTGGTIEESGALSYTNNLDSSDNISMTISVATPVTMIWNSAPGGETSTIAGTMNVATSCFSGSLTLATPTPMFFPSETDCPTAGEVTVSGSVNGSVVYTSTGGVQIKDSSGAVVETYSSCDDIEVCS